MGWLSSLFTGLKLALAGLVLWFVKESGKKEQVAEDTARNLELQKDYTENHTNPPPPEKMSDRVRSGEF